jgi:hypothetical protein
MTQPTITIKRLDLMGYTPEAQMWLILNGGGGQKTFNFLKHWAAKGAFDSLTFMGQPYNGLRGERARHFAQFAAEHGFEVVWDHSYRAAA